MIHAVCLARSKHSSPISWCYYYYNYYPCPSLTHLVPRPSEGLALFCPSAIPFLPPPLLVNIDPSPRELLFPLSKCPWTFLVIFRFLPCILHNQDRVSSLLYSDSLGRQQSLHICASALPVNTVSRIDWPSTNICWKNEWIDSFWEP